MPNHRAVQSPQVTDAATERTKAIDRLALGLAHDIKNLLTVMMGFAQFIRAQRPQDKDMLENVEEILQAGDRANRLVEKLQVIGGRVEVTPKPIALHEVLQRMAPMLDQLTGEGIRVVYQLAERPLTVQFDEQGLTQMIHSLGQYAFHVMPRGGTMTIATSPVTLGVEQCRLHPSVTVVTGTFLSVVTTDGGLDPALTGRVVEPYFMKRELRRGSGLDLSEVCGWVNMNGGFADVLAQPDQCTTLQLYLPGTDSNT